MTRWLIGSMVVLTVTAVVNMLTGEIQGRLARLPLGLLWLVARRLPMAQRKVVYEEEWRPELIAQLQDSDSLPITCLFKGIAFAADMIRATPDIAKLRREPAESLVAHAQVAEARGGVSLPKMAISGTATVTSSATATLQASSTLTAGCQATRAEADRVRRTIEQMAADTRARTGMRLILPPSSEQPGS